MQFKTMAVILGAKSFNDVVEGTKYDNTKLLVLMEQKEVNSDRQNSIGYTVELVPFETSAEYEKHKLHAQPYPHEAELDMELTNKGPICTGYKFLGKSNTVKPV